MVEELDLRVGTQLIEYRLIDAVGGVKHLRRIGSDGLLLESAEPTDARTVKAEQHGW